MRLGLLLVGGLSFLPATSPAAVGGGWSDGGIEGAYFANPDLAGTPAFSRKEVRLQFDWTAGRPVGGSTSEPYASFPDKGFLVRWSGKVIPRFSETYTLVVDAADGARVRWRNKPSADWQTLVDAWDGKAAVHRLPIGPLVAGQPAELEFSYRQHAATGRCVVKWSSPSTPEEIVDPVAEQGLMLGYNFFADLVKVSAWKNPAKDVAQEVDTNGFATSDAVLAMNGDALRGAYLLRIGGQAEVGIRAVFKVGDKTFPNVLPAGAGYDPKTNVTTAFVRIDAEGPIEIALRQTSRDGSGKAGTGVGTGSWARGVGTGCGHGVRARGQALLLNLQCVCIFVSCLLTVRRLCGK